MAGWYPSSHSSQSKSKSISGKLKNIDLKGCVHFAYDDLKEATDNFNQNPLSKGGNKLGEGGFGPVYKGELRCTQVAIKGISKRARGGMGDMVDVQFLTEVEVLSKFRHPNLVTLLGCSVDGEVPYLVYEYLTNGTLEDAIEYKYEKGVSFRLSWQLRQSIALDTARGLLYLHTADPNQPLVHRDVKSANVLLDHSYRAKVGDFGLARVLDVGRSKQNHGGNRLYEGKEAATTVNIIGTSGYIPKEYLEGIITPKMDVYAFGVILLELLSGLASYDSRRTIKDLTTYLGSEIIEPRKFLGRVDPEAGAWPSESVVLFAEVAAECLKEDRKDRLTMEEAYKRLDVILVESARLASEEEYFKKKATQNQAPGGKAK